MSSISTSSYVIVSSATITVAREGYQFFKDPFGKSFEIRPGQLIGWTGTGDISIATDKTKEFASSDLPQSEKLPGAYAYHIRHYVSEITVTEYKRNLNIGIYGLTAKVINHPFDNSGISGVIQRFSVGQIIQSIRILTPGCEIGSNCSIKAQSTPEIAFFNNPARPTNNYTLTWRFRCTKTGNPNLVVENNVIVTNKAELIYNFSSYCTCVFNVTAANYMTSNVGTLHTLKVSSYVDSPTVFGKMASTNKSASTVNVPANFLFRIKGGTDYTCRIDFGLFSFMLVYSPFVDYNGHTFKLTYSKQGWNPLGKHSFFCEVPSYCFGLSACPITLF